MWVDVPCAHLGQAQFNDDELLDFLNDSKQTGATESVSSIRSTRYPCAARSVHPASPSVSYTPAPLFPKPSAPLARPPQTKPVPKSLSSSFGADPAPAAAEPAAHSSPVVSRFLAPLSPAPSEQPRAPPSPAPQHARNPSREIAPASVEASDPISLLDSPAPPSPASSAPSAGSAAPAAVGNSESVAALRNQRDQVELANRMLKTQMKELNGELQEMSERTKAASAAAEKAMEQV